VCLENTCSAHTLHCLLLLSAASVAAPETFKQPRDDSLHSQTDCLFLTKNTVSLSFLAHAVMFFWMEHIQKKIAGSHLLHACQLLCISLNEKRQFLKGTYPARSVRVWAGTDGCEGLANVSISMWKEISSA